MMAAQPASNRRRRFAIGRLQGQEPSRVETRENARYLRAIRGTRIQESNSITEVSRPHPPHGGALAISNRYSPRRDWKVRFANGRLC